MPFHYGYYDIPDFPIELVEPPFRRLHKPLADELVRRRHDGELFEPPFPTLHKPFDDEEHHQPRRKPWFRPFDGEPSPKPRRKTLADELVRRRHDGELFEPPFPTLHKPFDDEEHYQPWHKPWLRPFDGEPSPIPPKREQPWHKPLADELVKRRHDGELLEPPFPPLHKPFDDEEHHQPWRKPWLRPFHGEPSPIPPKREQPWSISPKRGQKLTESIIPSVTPMSQKRKENEKAETSSSDGEETSSDGEQKQDMVEEEKRYQPPTPLHLQPTTTGQKDKEKEKIAELLMSLPLQPTTTDTEQVWDKVEQEEIKPTDPLLVQPTRVDREEEKDKTSEEQERKRVRDTLQREEIELWRPHQFQPTSSIVDQKVKEKEKAPAELERGQEEIQFQPAIVDQKGKEKVIEKTPTKRERDSEKHTGVDLEEIERLQPTSSIVDQKVKKKDKAPADREWGQEEIQFQPAIVDQKAKEKVIEKTPTKREQDSEKHTGVYQEEIEQLQPTSSIVDQKVKKKENAPAEREREREQEEIQFQPAIVDQKGKEKVIEKTPTKREQDSEKHTGVDQEEIERIQPTSLIVDQKVKKKDKAPAKREQEQEEIQFQPAIVDQKGKEKVIEKTPTKREQDSEKHTGVDQEAIEQLQPSTAEQKEKAKGSTEEQPLPTTTKKIVVVAAEPYLYRAVTTGDIKLLKQSLAKGVVELHAISSPQGNTVLHVASSFGHHEIVQIVYKRFPYLLMMTNSKGDTALHNAARDGHLTVVKFLIDCTKESVGGDVEKGNNRELLKMKNLEGNTALLECTKKGHQSVARVLIEADGELPNLVNNSGESTFYLAAELGLYELVKQLLELPIDHSLPEPQQHKTALHAAILQNHTSIIKILLEKKPELLDSRDLNGRSCLYYAAFLGCLEDVRCLLNTPNAHYGDPEGSFPIHVAAMKGHLHVIQELLARVPDSRELLDHKGRNALHVAVLNNKENVVRFILETPELDKLINEVDLKGNTPLHLATIHSHPRIASILTRDRRVDMGIMNKDGLTAYEAGKLAIPSFKKVLTVGVLKSANASSLCRRQLSKENIDDEMLDEKTTRQSFKDGINTLVVVATLIVTVTFAAGLSMPGGFPNKGNPDMLTKAMRYVFVISNTIAMYSSIMASITLLWAHIGDLNQLNFALDWSTKLLAMALTMVALAFAAGTNLMVSQLGWLPIAVLGLSLIFLPCILALLTPLLVPILPKNRWLRVLSNYSFQFLLFTSTYEVTVE